MAKVVAYAVAILILCGVVSLKLTAWKECRSDGHSVAYCISLIH